MRTAILVLTTILLSSILHAAFAENDGNSSVPAFAEGETAAWGSSRMTLIEKGRKKDRGYALFTTSDQVPGIAFRCHRKKLFAFVSVKPVSFRKLLEKWFRNPAEWQVEYRVDGSEPKVEAWIWTHKGRVFMSRPGESANDLFHAARRGATIDFQRKHGDPVTIEVPPGDVDRFESFVEKCGLSDTDLGSVET